MLLARAEQLGHPGTLAHDLRNRPFYDSHSRTPIGRRGCPGATSLSTRWMAWIGIGGRFGSERVDASSEDGVVPTLLVVVGVRELPDGGRDAAAHVKAITTRLPGASVSVCL